MMTGLQIAVMVLGVLIGSFTGTAIANWRDKLYTRKILRQARKQFEASKFETLSQHLADKPHGAFASKSQQVELPLVFNPPLTPSDEL